jgi:hypothetical protein
MHAARLIVHFIMHAARLIVHFIMHAARLIVHFIMHAARLMHVYSAHNVDGCDACVHLPLRSLRTFVLLVLRVYAIYLITQRTTTREAHQPAPIDSGSGSTEAVSRRWKVNVGPLAR